VKFADQHIGPNAAEREEMLEIIGSLSLDKLIDQSIPPGIRADSPLNLPPGQSEQEFLRELREIASKNRLFRSYIGLGYYGCHTPSVIVRNVLENPGWYTPYTPYQAEIAQGRLEALLNFQTMVSDLTGLEMANASLLDEATAAAEAMSMLLRVHARRVGNGTRPSRFFVDSGCFPQTIEVLKGRAEPLGIELAIGDWRRVDFADPEFTAGMYGVLLQTPDESGNIHDLRECIGTAKRAGLLSAVATDLLSCALLRPPGEMGADVAIGNSQRFGVPMGYGGPHAAFFATSKEYARHLPGRIIGVSVDTQGNAAYRLALQTREQHIRRDKATSNICTAQALLASIAGFYAVCHGPQGLQAIARRVHGYAKLLECELARCGFGQLNEYFFDTLRVELPAGVGELLREAATAAQINLRYRPDGTVNIALDETTNDADVEALVEVFRKVGRERYRLPNPRPWTDIAYPPELARTSRILSHSVFHRHHSETQMMRYMRSLQRRDLGLDTSMIPLGSCTMKLNAAAEMLLVTWPEFSRLHPFAPVEQAAGYQQIFRELSSALCEITGFAAVSFQPNSGAQGEFAGLMVIRAYQRDRNEGFRDTVLIPASAHGTNPASAVMAGLRVVVVASTPEGNIDVDDLRARAEEYRARLAALMVTYPSTHGVFEERIQEICEIVHANGGQVYMDGANMNAQVGLTSPARIGADVCHINLHKTFSIPHGGGGPGMGPIAVAEHLAPYLPSHPLIPTGGERPIPPVSAAPWSSASILLISYAYIRMLGGDGMTNATRHAILNANYVKTRLERHYPVLYTGPFGRVAHEFILDFRPLKEASGIDEIDVAKRLIDFGFHAPTVSFPVPGTMMIEPTESEDKQELDRFCEAMIAIRAEIQSVIGGEEKVSHSALKRAPHTAGMLMASEWVHPYSREQAAFPLPWVRNDKFWPAVARIDNVFGDRNLVCTCPPVEVYGEQLSSVEI
jgi:glycine dehydrogenase